MVVRDVVVEWWWRWLVVSSSLVHSATTIQGLHLQLIPSKTKKIQVFPLLLLLSLANSVSVFSLRNLNFLHNSTPVYKAGEKVCVFCYLCCSRETTTAREIDRRGKRMQLNNSLNSGSTQQKEKQRFLTTGWMMSNACQHPLIFMLSHSLLPHC